LVFPRPGADYVAPGKNLGFFFSLINVHISCALGTILFALCCMVCVLLCYLGYRRFCHPTKNKEATTEPPPPPTCVTCLSCPPPTSTSLRPWDKEAMEDRYYASMQRQRYDNDDFGFAPQCYKQPRQPRYNRGRIVDYIDHEPVLWLMPWLLLPWLKSIKFSHLRLCHSILATMQLLLRDSPP
jgi:hypothetical protein